MSEGAAAAGILGMLGMGCLIILAICYIPLVFYILSVKGALEKIAPQRREMEPGMAWLMLIPVFSLVWHFFVVIKLTASFRREFEARGLQTDDPQFGYTLGLITCICPLAGWVPIIGILASLGGLVCWILWWIKVANYSKQLS